MSEPLVPEPLVVATFLVVGLVHLLPGVVACSVRQAERAYGIDATQPDVAVVVRHRGVLLATVGVGLLTATAVPDLRTAAAGAAVASMVGFVGLAATTRDVGRPLRRVMWIDVAAITLLLPAVPWW